MRVNRLVINGLSDDEQAWLDVLWDVLCDRYPNNVQRAAYYDLKHVAPTRRTLIAPQYRTMKSVLGWNAKAVDMLARRTNPEEFYWTGGDLASLGYDDLVESNSLFAEFKGGLVSSLIHGPAFSINSEGDPSEREPKSLIHVKDALSASGWWNNRRRRLDAVLSITSWAEGRELRPDGLILYFHGLTVTAERERGRKWTVDRRNHEYGMPVEPLVYRPRIGRTLGSSRITPPQMDLQDRAVRGILRMEGHMDVYSVPQMWLLGADSKIFQNADGTQKTAWQIALGRMFGIPDNPDINPDSPNARADVKHIPAQSPEPHMAQLSVLAKLFAREANLPDSALAITDMANPTAPEAYLLANEDLIAEAEGATSDWELPLRRSVVRGLAIQNGDPSLMESARGLQLRWRPAMYVSKAAQADAGQKQIASAPWLAETEVGLELLGLRPDQIDRAMSEQSRAQARTTLASVVGGGAPVEMADDADPR